MNLKKRISKNDWYDIVSIIVIGIVLLAFFAVRGAGEYPDTFGYINYDLDIMGEPLYPLFLAFFRKVFGTQIYLTVVAGFQIAFTLFSVWYLVRYIADLFHVEGIFRSMMFFICLAFLVLPAVFSVTGIVTFLSILTEGVSYSMFFCFFVCVCKAVIDRTNKHLVFSAIWATLISLLRTQLMFTMVIVFLAAVYLVVVSQEKCKTLLFCLVMFVLSFGVMNIVQISFSRCVYQEKKAIGNSINLYANIMYLGTLDDAQLFQDADVRDIYLEIYNIKTENQWSWETFDGAGFIDAAMNLEKSHDELKDAFVIVMDGYLNEAGIEGDIERYRIQNEFAKEIYTTLLPQHITQWVYDYVCLCLVGFVRTVAVAPTNFMMQLYTIIIYAMFVLCGIINRKDKKFLLYMIVTSLGVLGNVSETSIVIMCLSRYMVYMFPMVYFALIIEFEKLVKGVVAKSVNK